MFLFLVNILFILFHSYDPNFVCNHSDDSGRYSYRKQPEICHWNLKKFAEALKVILFLKKNYCEITI